MTADPLARLHEALLAASREHGLEDRLRVLVRAAAAIAGGAGTIVVREARMEPTMLVRVRPTGPEAFVEQLVTPVRAAVWRRWLRIFERRADVLRASGATGAVHALDLADPWARREFGPALCGIADEAVRIDDGGVPAAPGAPEPAGLLVAPLGGVEGEVVATLVVEVRGAWPPSPASVRAIELVGHQVAQYVAESRLSAIAERRAERLQRLRDAGAALTRSLDEHEVARELARQLVRLVPADGIVVAHPDLARGVVRTPLRQVRGLARHRAEQPLGSGPIAEVARTGRVVRVDDYTPGVSPLAAADDVVGDGGPAGSVLAAPMRVGTQLIGVVAVHAAAPRAFDAEHEELLRAVASQAATAIANARLFAESERERRQTEALADVARAVGGSLRFGDVMRLVLRHTAALLHAGGACVALERGDYLHIVAGVGSAGLLAGVHVPVASSMMGAALRTGRHFISNDVPHDEADYRALRRITPIEKAVLVPLVAASGPIGVVVAVNRVEDFTEADARVLQRLADHVAVAIVNARLYEEVATATREWKVAFDTIAAGMVVLDDRGAIVRANARAAELTARPGVDALAGCDLREALGIAASCDDDVVERACAGGETVRATIATADGRHFDVVAAPHPDGGAVVTFDDVTAHHALRAAVAASEARYRQLFESASDAIYTLDARGVCTSANDATSALVGVPNAELIGASSSIFVAPEDRELVRERFEASVRGEPQRFECRMVGADGARKLISVTHTPIGRTDDGTATGVLAVARDVTAERERAVALERSEARYERLVEAASDVIFTVDADGRFTAVNHALEQATGRRRDTLLGADATALLGEERHAVTALMREALRGERVRGEARFLDLDGAERAGSVVAAPIVEGGVVTGALAIIRDVTDERRLAEQLMQREKLAALGRLVGGVAHELNNPLTSIATLAELLATDGHASVAPDAALILRETQRAVRIVERLQAFARQRAPERGATDVNRALLDALELRRHALRSEEIDIVVDLDYEIPPTWADAHQLQEVFLQLVAVAEDALRALDGGRALTLRTRRVGDTVAVTVAHPGNAVAGAIDTVLAPFTIVGEIVREHGGTIRRLDDAGTTLVVELPLVPPPAGV